MPTTSADPTRRNPASHAAILAATVELLEEVGYLELTIEAVARRAGVGKQTIYRWWGGSKADLVLEAFMGVSGERVPPPDTGTVRGDLLAIMQGVFALHGDLRRGTSLANKTLMASAQLDGEFHARYVELHRSWWGPLLDVLDRGMERGELRADADPAVIVDMLLGASWYRLLLEHAPLDAAAATALVDAVLHGAAAEAASPAQPTRPGAGRVRRSR